MPGVMQNSNAALAWSSLALCRSGTSDPAPTRRRRRLAAPATDQRAKTCEGGHRADAPSSRAPAVRTAADIRNRELAQIHIARQQLGMDEETYRAMLWAVGRVNSAKDLDWTGRKRVLDHLKKSGFKVKPAKSAKTRELASDMQSKKIRAMWLELHQAGEVRDPSEAALASFVKRHTKVEALQWLSGDQARRIIEHLKQWLARI